MKRRAVFVFVLTQQVHAYGVAQEAVDVWDHVDQRGRGEEPPEQRRPEHIRVVHFLVRVRTGNGRQQADQGKHEHRGPDEHGPPALVPVRDGARDRPDHQPRDRLQREHRADDERRVAPLFRYGRQKRAERRVTWTGR